MAQGHVQRVPQQSDRDLPTTVVERAESHPNPLPSDAQYITPSGSAVSSWLSGETTSATTPKEVYLQFWFEAPSSHSHRSDTFPSVRASTTTTPVPYNLGSGSASLDQLRRSKYHGAYDSRMDSTINTPTLPAILSKVIRFREPFSNVPEVAVWLTGFSSTIGTTVSVNATATNISTSQFTLQIDSSIGEELISVGAAWAAWNGYGKVTVGYCVGPSVVSGTEWELQLAAVSGVELDLKQGVFPELLVLVDVYADDTKVWNFLCGLRGKRVISRTVVTAMRRS